MLHHIITVDNDMLYHMDGVMRAWAERTTPLKENLFLAMRFARRKLFKSYTEVTT